MAQSRTDTAAILTGVLVIALMIALAASALKYNQLLSDALEACATTGAAAKLDLSSFVPLCEKVHP